MLFDQFSQVQRSTRWIRTVEALAESHFLGAGTALEEDSTRGQKQGLTQGRKWASWANLDPWDRATVTRDNMKNFDFILSSHLSIPDNFLTGASVTQMDSTPRGEKELVLQSPPPVCCAALFEEGRCPLDHLR